MVCDTKDFFVREFGLDFSVQLTLAGVTLYLTDSFGRLTFASERKKDVYFELESGSNIFFTTVNHYTIVFT